MEYYHEMLDTYKTQLELCEEGLKVKADELGGLILTETSKADGSVDAIAEASSALTRYIKAVYNVREMIRSLTETIRKEEEKIHG